MANLAHSARSKAAAIGTLVSTRGGRSPHPSLGHKNLRRNREDIYSRVLLDMQDHVTRASKTP